MLLYDYSKTLKFKRGQVWMVKEPEAVSNAKVEAGVGTICFTRPYVIVSSDEVCEKSYIVQGYPMTHSTNRLDDGIIFREPAPSTERSLILVDQLTPIESKNIVHYMFTLSSSLMEKIDSITAQRMGIPTTNDKIKEMSEKIKSLEKELSEAQHSKPGTRGLPKIEPINAYIGDAEETPESDDISNTCGKDSIKTTKKETSQKKTAAFDPHYQLVLYAKKVNHPAIRDQKNKPNNKIKIDINKYVDIFKSAIENKAFTEDNLKICDDWVKERIGYSVLCPNKRRTYNRWTTDKMREFMNDLETLSKKDVASKYGLKIKTIADKKWLFKKRLDEMGLLK